LKDNPPLHVLHPVTSVAFSFPIVIFFIMINTIV
jgi:hypothetical protein